MADLVHQLIFETVQSKGEREALKYGAVAFDYYTLAQSVRRFADALVAFQLGRGERVAVYAEKRLETVVALFGAAAAGGVFVR